jgi:predicted transcriptional regulator of viral defense system
MYSTKYLKQNRFQILAAMDEEIFHRDDLARLWNIDNPNTLNVALYRYVRNNLLYRIYKGFYSIKPPEKLNPYLLGIKAVHRFAYISTETVLFEEGIINQAPDAVSIISSVSRTYTISERNYKCRKLKPIHLMNPAGLVDMGGYKKADINRAVADLLYFNKLYYFDNEAFIDWETVKEMQTLVGYSETPARYNS